MGATDEHQMREWTDFLAGRASPPSLPDAVQHALMMVEGIANLLNRLSDVLVSIEDHEGRLTFYDRVSDLRSRAFVPEVFNSMSGWFDNLEQLHREAVCYAGLLNEARRH